jgi:predicted RecB family nuclease
MGGGSTSRALPPEPAVDDRVSGNHLWLLHKCERRLWLDRHAPAEAAAGGEFEELLREKGREHEEAVRSRMAPCEGPVHWRGRPIEESVADTARLLRESRATLYQPALASADGRAVGVPDFLYWDGATPVVHDAKLASDLKSHGEIALQLTHYRELLADMGLPDAQLEITTGRDEVVAVDPVPHDAYRAARARAAELLRGGPEPDTLLSHSTCEACPFYDHCWDRAQAEHRVEILPDVYVADVPMLRELGIRTYDQLAARAPDAIPSKGRGARAANMVHGARAHRDGQPVWIDTPRLPAGRPLVWFDLEGVTELEESPHPIYLWGLAVEDDGDDIAFEPIFAEPGEAGNRAAWERFVARSTELLDHSAGTLFIHYASYEKGWVRRYAEMFGAPDGWLARMEEAMWDLYQQGVIKWVRLPLRSSSIKKVAPYVGFSWSDPESGSLWSVVQYRKAMAAGDPAQRQRLLEPIARYNADDLRAMRAVWRWIEREGPRG